MEGTLSSEQKELCAFFPEADLPVMFSQDQIFDFSEMNDPFPGKFVDEVLMLWEKEIDEFTEFIPCVYLPPQENYVAVIYWKGGLLKYEFILVTINKKGELINRKVIATTYAEGKTIKQSAAYIDGDLNITIIAGQTTEGALYDSALSQTFGMEIMFNGEIVLHLENN